MKKLFYRNLIEEIQGNIESLYVFSLNKNEFRNYEPISTVRKTCYTEHQMQCREIFNRLVTSKIHYVETQANLQEQTGKLRMAINEATEQKKSKDKQIDLNTKSFSRSWGMGSIFGSRKK